MSVFGEGIEILKLVNKGANTDLYEKLGKFVDRANDLQAKIEQLEQINSELRDKLRIKNALYQVWGVLFIQGDPYPLCSKCYEVDRKLVHLDLPAKRAYNEPRCPNCGIYYDKADFRERLPGPEVAFLL